MYRYFSFGLLVAAIGLLTYLFYKVMAGFFLPLFLAALLVVIFRPMHEWILKKVKGRPKLGAFLTTAAILLVVLLPLTLTLIFAASEGRAVLRKMDPATIGDKFQTVRRKFGLEMPAVQGFSRFDKSIQMIRDQSIEPDLDEQRSELQYDVTELRGLAVQLAAAIQKDDRAKVKVEWTDTLKIPLDTAVENEEKTNEKEPTTNETNWVPIEKSQVHWAEFNNRMLKSRAMLTDESWSQLDDNDDKKQKQLVEARADFQTGIEEFFDFKTQLLGGPITGWATELLNPDPTELDSYIEKAVAWLKGNAPSLGTATMAFLVKTVFGLLIMSLALFSFLLDGPAMLNGLKALSPLDDQNEDELFQEFDRVSRAVVLATLLSALAQAILAAIGFYFAGLEAIMLLMVLTAVLALVPFLGAAAVWVPAALYVALVDGRMVPGILLGVYGIAIISMADNVIKPFVLHGRSNLHPLWALLSVLGGVSALGPIGILIGPMVVAFLQTLLQILQRELSQFEQAETAAESAAT